MKEIHLFRHAMREKDADALTAEGRAQAENLGMRLPSNYAVVFISPAKRAAETAAWILRGSKQSLPDHAVVAGLASDEEAQWRAACKEAGTARLDAVRARAPDLVARECERLAEVVNGLFKRLADGTTALAVGHSPLMEAAAYGLTSIIVEPLAECEGLSITLDDAGVHRIEDLRPLR